MSAKLRKFLIFSTALLCFIIAASAMAFFGGHTLFKDDRSAYADVFKTVIASPKAEYEISYGDWPLDTSKYVITLMQRAEENGEEDGADSAEMQPTFTPDVGKYFVTVAPAEGFRFEDFEPQKSFALKVNQAKLTWTFPTQKASDYTENQGHEVVYTGTNQIGNVWAVNGSLKHNILQSTVFNYTKNNMKVTSNEEEVTAATNVGEYVFTVANKDNYENGTFTLTIFEKEVNIALSGELYWLADGSVNNFSSANIYEYTYNESGESARSTAYTSIPTQKAPYENWLDWQPVNPQNPVHANSVVAYREGHTSRLTLANAEGNLSKFSASYSGENTARTSGKYTVTAQISPKNNYKLKCDGVNPDDTMSIHDNGDGTFTVTKVWYVAHFLNRIISADSSGASATPYTFVNGWVFGQYPHNMVELPVLEHGDEIKMYEAADTESARNLRKQPDGYTLFIDGVQLLSVQGDDMQTFVYPDAEEWLSGEKDALTFSLTRNGEIICSDKPRKDFSYYINAYMPVGTYVITFDIKSVGVAVHNHWWNGERATGCGGVYTGIAQSFTFAVTAADLDYDDSALNFYGDDSKAHYDVNISSLSGGYHAFFDVAEEYFVSSNAVTKADAKSSATFWGEEQNADKYFAYSALCFKLEGQQGDYAYADSDVWRDLLTRPDTYRVYYTLALPNYNVPNLGDGAHRYFIVDMYEVLPLPELSPPSKSWTGGALEFKPESDDERYTLSDNVQTDVGDYKAKFTLLDAVHYRWDGVVGAVYEAGFSITRRANGWIENGSPKISGWRQGGFDAERNGITAAATFGEVVFTVTTDADGLSPVVGLTSFKLGENGSLPEEAVAAFKGLGAGTYYLWGEVARGDTYEAVARTSCEFAVERLSPPSGKDATNRGLIIALCVLGGVAVCALAAVAALKIGNRKNGGDSPDGADGNNADGNDKSNGNDKSDGDDKTDGDGADGGDNGDARDGTDSSAD